LNQDEQNFFQDAFSFESLIQWMDFPPENEILYMEKAQPEASMKTVIKGGTIVTASETYRAEIFIDGETIRKIACEIAEPADHVIDATGKYILPGGIDVHTHFALPMMGTISSDDHYTGHKAAAFGGTTTTIDVVSQDFDSLNECVDAWHQKADPWPRWTTHFT
jgi:hypothetical protein